jgi:hypothetical protein
VQAGELAESIDRVRGAIGHQARRGGGRRRRSRWRRRGRGDDLRGAAAADQEARSTEERGTQEARPADDHEAASEHVDRLQLAGMTFA